MRLTIDLIRFAASYINAIGEREISLRAYQIPAIENLGILEDSYDCIDLSENSIIIMENFPLMPRLTTLLFHNNKIKKILKGLSQFLPNLQNLMLTNNQISNFNDLDGIEEFSNLLRLSLIGNPITKEKNYRLYIIAHLPNLKHLDFKKIKKSERIEANKLFHDVVARNKQSQPSHTQHQQQHPQQTQSKNKNMITKDEDITMNNMNNMNNNNININTNINNNNNSTLPLQVDDNNDVNDNIDNNNDNDNNSHNVLITQQESIIISTTTFASNNQQNEQTLLPTTFKDQRTPSKDWNAQ